jgi:hypothetical protein
LKKEKEFDIFLSIAFYGVLNGHRQTKGIQMKKSMMVVIMAGALAAVSSGFAEDPYIQLSGSSGISTGYRMKCGISRVEVDFALTTTDSCAQWRIFGSDAQESSLMTYMYIDGSSQYTLIVKPNGMSRYTTYVADTQRHTAVIDLYHSGLHFITAGVTNWTTTAETSFSGREADLPLSIFGRYSNAYANKFELCAKARIYGVKIYENDVPVHDFVPCLKEGVACFKDIIGGGFITGEDESVITSQGSYTMSVWMNSDNVSDPATRTAVVPAEYMTWQPGYSYTYIFKITEQGGVEIDMVQSAVTPWTELENDHQVYNW